MQIAVIDRGIDFYHPKLIKCTNSSTNISSDGEFSVVHDHIDETGHGTAIAGIIHKISPKAHIISVKLVAQKEIISELHLAKAIRWCSEQESIRVINISLGVATNSPTTELYDACMNAYINNKIIVAAVHNFPYLNCYPAYFNHVIGVGCGLVSRNQEFGYVGPGCTNILAKGTVQRVLWSGQTYRLTSGTSYANPHFAAILCNMLLENPIVIHRDDIYNLIVDSAKKNIQELNYIKKTHNSSIIIDEDKRDALGRALFKNRIQYDGVKNLAIFPCCEKEMRSLLELRQALPFEVKLLIDYPRAYTANSFDSVTTNAIRGQLNGKDISCFDTIVIGYFLDQPFDANINYGFNLIRDCINHNKNFIIWDYNVYNYVKKELKKYSDFKGRIIFHYVDDAKYLDILNYQYLPEIHVPVITVAGTGSRQGKVSTQVKLKKILHDFGYKASLLSTEPQGGLLGADFCFPYGHNSTVYLDLNRWDEFLQYTLKGIQHYNSPDIIICGTQGGVIPFNPSALVNYEASILRSLQFLIGVQSDAIVLTVNASDSIDFIRKNIQTISVFCSAKLIFIAMSPYLVNNKMLSSRDKLDKTEYKERMFLLQDELNILVLDIFDENNNELILEIIEYTFKNELV